MKASTTLSHFFLALFMGTICVFSTSFLVATTINPAKEGAITYYNKAGQSITELSSWNTQTDGNGVSPAGFNIDNAIWNIIHDAVLAEELTISGENSKVVVGDGTNEIELALSMTSDLDAVVDIINQGSLILTTNNYPTFGTFHPESRVTFATGGQRKIPYHDYHDLFIVNTKPVFEDEGDRTVKIRGVLVLEGNVTFPQARGEVEYKFLFHGPFNQGISTDGNVFRSYNLTFDKSSGAVWLDADAIVSSDNKMTFKITENAEFVDNGATLIAGNNVNVDGLASAYDFTGTLILAGTEPGFVNGAGAGNDFNVRNNEVDGKNPVAAFNNIIIRAANTGGQFHFRDGGSNHFEVKGNLIIESQADGRVSFYNNRVSIGGDYIIGDGFAGSVDPFERLGLNGGDLQKIDLGKNSTTKILDITNDIIIQQGSLVTTDVLNADATIKTSDSGLLVIKTTTVLNGIDQDNYIQGNLGFMVSGDGTSELEFTIGTDLQFAPLKLNITHEGTGEVIHYARAMNTGLPDLNLPDELEVIYPDYFYFLGLDPSNQFTTGEIALPFFTPVKEFDSSLLRIARAGKEQWVNLGGKIDDGFIRSETPIMEGGIFSLAKYLPSTDKMITSFVFPSLDPVVVGSIDEEAKTISAEVPHGTDISMLAPAVEFTGVGIEPSSGIAQDFSQPVKYTVTAEDNSTIEYTVTVKVAKPLFTVTLNLNLPGAATLTGGGEIATGDPVSVSFEINEGFKFANWTWGDDIVSTDNPYSFTMPDSNVTLTANFELLKGDELVYYWHFNNLTEGTLTTIDADFSAGGKATITYSGEGSGIMDRVNDDGSTLNLQMDQSPGKSLRVRNPSETRELIFDIPSGGFKNLFFSFAIKRTNNGAQAQLFSVSTDGGNTWIPRGESYDIGLEYMVKSFDLTELVTANDNDELKFKIQFSGENASLNEGNNRFDNISLSGTVIIPDNLPPLVENPVLLQQTIEKGTGITIDLTHVFADPEGEPLTFTAESNHPEMVSVQLADYILTISPVRRGGAVITITATDNLPQSVSSDFHVLVYPEAHDLLAIPFVFDNFAPNEPEFSYPESMLFLQSNMEDPGLTADLLYPYFIPEYDYHADDTNNIGFPYQNTRRTRINALGNEGISFINTDRDRDLGGALAAINTSGIQGARVGWTAATIAQNSRVYAIRLQYRTDIAVDFADLLDENGNVVEYKVNTDGHIQIMDPVKLPPALDNQPYVQLLWRYYWVEGDSGARPELRLDDIAVTWTMNAETISKPTVLIFNQGNRISLTKPTDELAFIEIYDLTGKRVHSASIASAGTHTWSLPVQSGVYMVRYHNSNELISKKIMIR
jgi:hypothetical protein